MGHPGWEFEEDGQKSGEILLEEGEIPSEDLEDKVQSEGGRNDMDLAYVLNFEPGKGSKVP